MKDKSVICFTKDCSLSNIREHHADLVTGLHQAKAVVLDLSGVEQSDITFVQLLASASRTAAAQGRPLRLAGVPAGLLATFHRAGLSFDPATGNFLQH